MIMNDEMYVVYGAGFVGKIIHEILEDKIEFFIDNNSCAKMLSKDGKTQLEIKRFDICKEELKDKNIIIAIDDKNVVDEVKTLLEVCNVRKIYEYPEIAIEFIKSSNTLYDYSSILELMLKEGCETFLFYLNVWLHQYSSLVPVIDRILENKNIARAVDMGSGYGFWTLFLASKGIEVTALEIVKERIDFINQLCAGKGVHAFYSDITKDMMEIQDCDLVMDVHMLHVMREWKKVVSACANLVQTNKYIIVVEPNVLDERFDYVRTVGNCYEIPDDFSFENVIYEFKCNDCELLEEYDVDLKQYDCPSDKILVFRKKREK